MSKTARTVWPLAAALLLLLVGCGPPESHADGVHAAKVVTADDPAADAAHPAEVDHATTMSPNMVGPETGDENIASNGGARAGHGSHADHAALGELPATDPTAHSVYLLPTAWRDRHGRDVVLEDLAGRIQVVAMVYTHCSFACPRILAQMKRLEAGVGDAARSDRVGFTLVSLDPERDTPGRLADFGESLRLDESTWTLLTGTDDDVRALSVLLGVKYRANADGGIDHSNVITILDEDGVPIHRIEGLDADTGPALAAILDRIP